MPGAPTHLEDLSGSGTRSSRVLAAIVTWTISAFKTRGINIDPNFKLDRTALKRVSRVVCVVPLVNGAAALLELLSRLILLILFLALSCTPRHRTVMMERMRVTLRMHVQSVRRLSVLAETDDASTRRRKSSLPPEASVLIVGESAVGKSALCDALHRLAKQAGREEALVVAESHGLSLPPALGAFPQLRLLVIVWEAALGTPLPAYVANYARQLEHRCPPSDCAAAATASASALTSPRTSLWRRGSNALNRVTGLPAAEPPPLPVGGSTDATSPRDEAEATDEAATRARGSPPPRRSADSPHATTGVAAPPARRQAGGGQAASAGEGASAAAEGVAGGPPGRPPLRVLVVCNKTDSMPCPMPQIQGLKPETAFIALSALRGTNLAHLWKMVAPLLPEGPCASPGGGGGGGGGGSGRGAGALPPKPQAGRDE